MGTSVLTSSDPSMVREVQRRTLWVLMLTQIIGGMGVAIGITVGVLLAQTMGGIALSGLGQSSLVIGAALLALPVTRLMRNQGRRPGLVLAYGLGALGGLVIFAAAAFGSIWLLFAGLFLFGGGSAANYQARYAAIDLAEPARRGQQLSWVVWATTIGAVSGPFLAPIANRALVNLGAANYSGPFVFSMLAFVLAGLLIALLLRPDPLLLAHRVAADARAAAAAPDAGSEGASGVASASDATASQDAASGARGRAARETGLGAAIREVVASPAARLGVGAVAMGHLVMVGVMSMTPVHIGTAGHSETDTLTIVAIVLSLHIAGMYAISPITGWLTDRLGRRPVILGGLALLVTACAVAGTAGHGTLRLSLGLILLGTGWSATMVAGSTLLSESVGEANKPSVQGLSDLVMGLAGASAGALSGVIVAWSSYQTLTMLAAIATVPLIALALRPVSRPDPAQA